MSALSVLPGGAEGGTAPWTGRLVALDLVDALADSAGSYDGDVAGFVGRALPIVASIQPPLPASASALRRARLHALRGGGEVTDGRAVLRVAG
ncbi:MAG TPA: hypothetical protein VFD90_08540 [Gaiellales bacterium]|nr:hypothetical protein [Gaiellales bacterium]